MTGTLFWSISSDATLEDINHAMTPMSVLDIRKGAIVLHAEYGPCLVLEKHNPTNSKDRSMLLEPVNKKAKEMLGEPFALREFDMGKILRGTSVKGKVIYNSK